MPTLLGRRYMRKVEAVGRTEKACGVVILVLVAGVLTLFVLQVATDRRKLFEPDPESYGVPEAGSIERGWGLSVSSDERANSFPEAGLEGWSRPTRVERLAPDDLYVKIDGRAEAYLRFGVVGLTFGRYVHESDPERTVDVYWYDMGSPEQALSVYRFEQPPDADPVAIGRAGYRVGGSVFFCQATAYVQVLPTRPDQTDAQAALAIATRLAESIDR